MAQRKTAQPAEKVADVDKGEPVLLRAHQVFGFTDYHGEKKRAYIGDFIRVDEATAVNLIHFGFAGGSVGQGTPTGDGKPVIVDLDADNEPDGPEDDEGDDDEIGLDDSKFVPSVDAPVTPLAE